MLALNRKLWRDLWQIRGQALAIALVIASGVATFVMFLSTLDSLNRSRESFYHAHRFADVFVTLKRAPEQMRERITEIPGIASVDTRVVAPVTIDIAAFPEPITGLINSVPDHGDALLNTIYLRSGRTVSSVRGDEVVISEAFAKTHRLRPGDRLPVIIKGIRKELRIVGTGISPEYIYQLRPGSSFPDFERYAVMWMARTPLGHAYDMNGAFNDVTVSLEQTAELQDVLKQLDELLTPYGSTGAIARKDQLSHRFLSQEFDMQDKMSGVFPIIFLAVAAFLLNVVVTRLVGTQREQIAALKAFGYSNRVVAWHYIQLVMIIVLFGSACGVALGAWLGYGLAELYLDIYRLPYLEFVLLPDVVVKAIGVSISVSLIGILFAVRIATRLRPAEAMRPEPPAHYRQTVLERAGLKHWLSPPARMILRHLERRPVKSGLSIIGIAMACAILTTGRFQEDTVGFMMDVQYSQEQRQDLAITFVEPTSRRVRYDLLNLPGVEHVEVFRLAPVQLRSQHYSYRTAIQGVELGGEIKRLLNSELQPVNLSSEGMVLSDYLAKLLHVKPGDYVTVEMLEGRRTVREIPVVALVNQFLGVSAYMELDALNRLLGEGDAVSGAFLSVDEPYLHGIFKRFKEMPRIIGTVVREQEIRNFYKTMHETLIFFVTIATVFAVVITVGVVYNSALITLTERSRELASLRVLGFTRAEISYILLGELALLTLLAIPLGLLLGRALCGYIASILESDLYRVPLILYPDTYAFAALTVLLAALISALMVRRNLDHLDLIAVLKTKE